MNFLLILIFALYWLPPAHAARDYYEVLGIAKTATPDEVRKAYKKAALAHHPDRNPGDADALAKFKEAKDAYDVLGDEEKRTRYDRFGTAVDSGGRSRGGGFSGGDPFGGYGGGPQPTAEEIKAAKRERAFKMADATGARYSNQWLKYDATKKAFYDTRTKLWSYFNPEENQLNFHTPEGYEFRPHEGSYTDWQSSGFLNPSESPEWRRFVQDTESWDPIDIRTGFSKRFRFNPRTTSDKSELFDRFLGPRESLDRAALEAEMAALEWTPARRRDFVARAKETLRSTRFNHGTHAQDLATTAAVFGSPVVERFPELMDHFVSYYPKLIPSFNYHYLTRDGWLNQPQAAEWAEGLFAERDGRIYFMDGLIGRNRNLPGAENDFPVDQFLRAAQHLFPQMTTSDIDHLMVTLGQIPDGALDRMRYVLETLLKSSDFMLALSNCEPHGQSYKKVLDWYQKYEPEIVEGYLKALEIETRMPTPWNQATYDRLRSQTKRSRQAIIQQRVVPYVHRGGGQICPLSKLAR